MDASATGGMMQGRAETGGAETGGAESAGGAATAGSGGVAAGGVGGAVYPIMDASPPVHHDVGSGGASRTDDAGAGAGGRSVTDSGAGVPGPCNPLSLDLVTSALNAPVFAAAPPGDARIFVLERATGHILVVSGNGAAPKTFLDLSSRIDTAGFEAGLLALAFDPGFAQNRAFYVSYTTASALRVSRFTVPAATPDVADPSSEAVIIDTPQASRHNQGGMLAFYQGLLYVALGDDDVQARSQDLGTLSGKLLRIAVDPSKSGYTIPTGNPFAGMAGAKPEIWARGLREPFRFSFDDPTSSLYLGDVGDATKEELDVVTASACAGGNFGWPITEADICHTPPSGCATTGLIQPVYTYPHQGEAAIIGGSVYRGKALSECYRGRYFFSDYPSGVVKTMQNNDPATVEVEPGLVLPGMVSLGVDGRGELLVIGGDHPLYRIVEGG